MDKKVNDDTQDAIFKRWHRKGGRGLASIEDSMDASTGQLKDYIKKEQRKTNNTDMMRDDIDRL